MTNTANPSCPTCDYDLAGSIATWNYADSVSCPMRGACSECGEEFFWADAFRIVNNYFDDLPRAGSFDGLGRSLHVSLFPWASRRAPSSARFSLRRSACVTVLELLVWHLVAAAWVVVMQRGWLRPWGSLQIDTPIYRVLLNPWSFDWGYILSRSKNSTTMQTMGGNGMLSTLVVAGSLWLVGLIVLAIALAIALARKRKPGGVRPWARAALRSAPAVGALTLAMSGSWVAMTSVEVWTGEAGGVLSFLVGLVLVLGTPITLVWLLWSRHVNDLGVFTRPRRVVLAMTLLPILALIAFAAFNASRAG